MRHLYLDVVMADSPRMLWECQDASGNLQDSSGNGLHMNSGSVSNYRHDGPMRDWRITCGGGVTPTRTSVVSTVTDNLTIEVLFQPQVIASDNQTVFYNGNGGANGYGLLIRSSGQVRGLCGGVALLNGAHTLSLSTWYHVCLRRSAGTWQIITDGNVSASIGANNPNAPSGSTVVNGTAIQAGYAYIAFYESALSDARIAEHVAAYKSLLRMGVLL